MQILVDSKFKYFLPIILVIITFERGAKKVPLGCKSVAKINLQPLEKAICAARIPEGFDQTGNLITEVDGIVTSR